MNANLQTSGSVYVTQQLVRVCRLFSSFSISEEETGRSASLTWAYGAFVVIGSFAQLCLFVVQAFLWNVFLSAFLCLYSSRSKFVG